MEAKYFLLPLLLGIFQFTLCISKDTITISQIFQDGDLLVSKKNNFALGFFSPANSSLRYMGIWYHKLAAQTVVWIANRNNPINGSSGVLSIDQYGNLILYGDNDRKNLVWSTNVLVDATEIFVAQLLDSGNLVLVHGRSKGIVWQSFDYPTDTLIPGMKLGLNRNTGIEWYITSWRSADDPGTGNYSMKLNTSGSPQFYLYEGTSPRWRSVSWPWRTYDDLHNYNYVNNQDEIYLSYYPLDASTLSRIVLDEAGLLKQLTWQESEGQWKEYCSVPTYRCDFYGLCGSNSNCNPTNVEAFECACLPGYEPKIPEEWHLRDGSSGCVRKQVVSSSACRHREGFVRVGPVKLPDTSAAVWVDMSMSRMDCERECLKNCSCSAYASIDIPDLGTGCLAWYGELMDTVNHEDDRFDLYVRVDALELVDGARKLNHFLEIKEFLSILAPAWFVIAIFAFLCLRNMKKKKAVRKKWNIGLFNGIAGPNDYYKDTVHVNERGESRIHPELAFFNLRTISTATNNFSEANKLGSGGFGSVYKGLLSNGQEVAVKRLSRNSGQGIKEFENEVMLITMLQHRNIIKLIGCCIQEEEQILIYEYLPNRSLDSFIFDETRSSLLDWQKRFDIVVGIARGILYLHQDSRLSIIHRDLNCNNILLDAEMNPKISHFGLARVFKGGQTEELTDHVVGTCGYMSPEYATSGKFSPKSDVFSFGVILLEIISGTKNNDFHDEDPSLSLIGKVWNLWREDRALEILDPSLKDSNLSYEMLRCIQIGLLCVQEEATDRPTMLAVIIMLNSGTVLPSPKAPAFIFRNAGNVPDTIIAVE